jgi:hypothetical protein
MVGHDNVIDPVRSISKQKVQHKKINVQHGKMNVQNKK